MRQDTTDHVPRHAESTAVLDLDPMRLGAAPDDFERYSWEVFGEQRPLIALDDDVAAWQFFDDKRAQFFQTLMQRPAIYHLAPMRAAYERPCYVNLGQTIRRDARSATACRLFGITLVTRGIGRN